MRWIKMLSLIGVIAFTCMPLHLHAGKVAIIDSGVNNVGSIPQYRDWLGQWDYYFNDGFPIDLHFHGTFVALSFLDVALSRPIGIPSITALQVFDMDGYITDGWYRAILDAGGQFENFRRHRTGGPLTLTDDFKIDVINLSIGGELYDEMEHIVLNEVYFNSDTLVVAAAGNEAKAGPDYPAALAFYFGARFIAVGAADANGNITEYSNRAGETNQNNFILAPGDYFGEEGTSFAAPRVSGLASLIKDTWPHLTSREIGDIILTTATDLGAPGPDPIYGRGLMNIEAALGPVGEPVVSVRQEKYSISETEFNLMKIIGGIGFQVKYVSYFDDYNRDFKMPLTPSNVSASDTILGLMDWFGSKSRLERRFRMEIDDISFTTNLPWIDTLPSSRSKWEDLSWQFDVNIGKFTGQLGYGNAYNWFYKPVGLLLGFSKDDATTSGHNPILQLAADGIHLSNTLFFDSDLSMTFGLASNQEALHVADSNAAAGATMVSVTKSAFDNHLVGNLTATYLVEDDGFLGSRLTGGFGQSNTYNTTGLTLSGEFHFGNGFSLSGSYTHAWSDTNPDDQGLLNFSEHITSNAFALGLVKKGILDNLDDISMSVSQPQRVIEGLVNLTHNDYYDENRRLHQRTVEVDLSEMGLSLIHI